MQLKDRYERIKYIYIYRKCNWKIESERIYYVTLSVRTLVCFIYIYMAYAADAAGCAMQVCIYYGVLC